MKIAASIAPADLDALLTPEEFAAWVGDGRDRQWAIDQAREGRVPAVKLGGLWRFHPRTVLDKCKTMKGSR